MGKKGGGQQTTTQKLDPFMQQYVNNQLAESQNVYANTNYQPYQGNRVAGIDPSSQDAATQFGNVAGLAGQGAAALGGDQKAFGHFMDPYQQNVIDQLGKSYDVQRNQAALGANDAATQAGAFGGDRHALLVGERQGQLDRQQASDTANLLYQGFNDAQNRAFQATNLGLGAAGQQFNAGDYQRQLTQQGLNNQYQDFLDKNNFDINKLNILRGGLQTPYGQQQSTPTSQNLGGKIAGGAAAGGAIGGPLGAGIGAGLGLFGIL